MAIQLSLFKDLALDLLGRYFRLEAQGLNQIPKKGPALIIANHSGVLGLDALLLADLIYKKTGRRPRIMAHHGYFDWVGSLREVSFRLKLREPSVEKAGQTIDHGHLLIIFPEGERGNFKSTTKRYQLQDFHTGFVRIAQKNKVPIIPALIIGSEETNINLGSISLDPWIRHLRIPVPLNWIPLPSKWKIKFLKPVKVNQSSHAKAAANKIRNLMQSQIKKALKKRPSIFL